MDSCYEKQEMFFVVMNEQLQLYNLKTKQCSYVMNKYTCGILIPVRVCILSNTTLTRTQYLVGEKS